MQVPSAKTAKHKSLWHRISSLSAEDSAVGSMAN